MIDLKTHAHVYLLLMLSALILTIGGLLSLDRMGEIGRQYATWSRNQAVLIANEERLLGNQALLMDQVERLLDQHAEILEHLRRGEAAARKQH